MRTLSGGAAGVRDRCRLEPADFLVSVPCGADVAMLCNLLTDWDDDHASLILRNCGAAMGDQGTIIVVDRVLPPSDDPTHRAVAFLDLFFLVLEGGRIRTSEEFSLLFEAAGFDLTRFVPVGSGFYSPVFWADPGGGLYGNPFSRRMCL